MFNKIERFLDKFPTNATSWREATDEVRDLAQASREMLDEYDDVQVDSIYFPFIKTPAEWNTLGREAILRNYDMMSPRTQLLFFERFEDWFNA